MDVKGRMMNETNVKIHGLNISVISLNTVIVGSGAAGLNAAGRLFDYGQKDIAVVTEGLNKGTSRNAGSDKQTYYKLTMAGNVSDSVYEMAETLFTGGSMHGDIALVEAALSSQCFYRLVDAGVPFPHNRYGEYIGYKTDHDPKQRATSAGPLTSRFMTEKLQEQIEHKGIRIFDRHQVIGILTDREKKKTIGLIALNLNEIGHPERRYTLFNCTNIVYATGGPAGMYGASVYPKSQTGTSGIAFEAGVKGKNLTESQFGIASVKFRWNLSGTYQQVLPRYVSTDRDGNCECEFIGEYFDSPAALLDAVFLKGYQWPFDARKVSDTTKSSLIDILVYYETAIKGRRVFLDYTRNPSSLLNKGEPDFSLTGQESRRYLEKSGALFGLPVDRLIHMNRPAYELFKGHGIDLKKEYLEIAVCAQHNNGGLYGNIWWESNLKHFFPVGEVNGSHGVYRPGGSALNSGQVGSKRAAQFISHRYRGKPLSIEEFLDSSSLQTEKKIIMGEQFIDSIGEKGTFKSIRKAIGARMNECGAIIRSLPKALEGIKETGAMLDNITENTQLSSIHELPEAFRNYDLLLAQYVYLNAIASYIEVHGKSRGSYLVHDPEGLLPAENLPEDFRFLPDHGELSGTIQVLSWEDGACAIDWEDVRPVPEDECWFENVWKDFMDDRIIE